MPFLAEGAGDLTTWRTQLGVVSQKEKIFNSTILDNIALSNVHEEVEVIAKQLQEMGWWSLFDAFPQGVLTLCGEEGRNLSAGQRQLVGLARAMVKKPKILIMDEATSAMDFETEGRVFTLVREFIINNRSGLLLITHQPTLAVSMDEVMILSEGKISTVGSPSVLLQEENLLSRSYQQVLAPNWK